MALLNDIEEYIRKKNNKAHNSVKKRFFQKIHMLMRENRLTVYNLTDALENIFKEGEQNDLFWSKSAGGPSPYSQAGILMKRVYGALGVHINDITMGGIITKGLSKYRKGLLEYPYHRWQKHPFVKNATVTLDHNLKGLLSFQENDYHNKNLAECLKHGFETDPLILTEKRLLLLYQQVPRYFSQVIYDLYQLSLEEENADFFIHNLGIIARQYPELAKPIGEAHPQIATHLVCNNPQFFFELSQAMQKNVYLQLKEENHFVLTQINLVIPLNRPETTDEIKEAIVEDFYRNRQDRRQTRRLLANFQTPSALNTIDKYLSDKKRSDYKKEFFLQLGRAIQKEGLTTELLKRHFLKADQNKLFKKWSGVHNSSAMHLLVELYKLANFVEPEEQLDSRDVLAHLSREGNSALSDFNGRQRKHLASIVKETLTHPGKAKTSLLEHVIATKAHTYHSYNHFVQKTQADTQKIREAQFQTYLIEKALTKAEAMVHNGRQADLIFDPQGHLLIPVTLTPADHIALQQLFYPLGYEEVFDLEKELGRAYTSTIFCNLDISGLNTNLYPDFKSQFKQRMGGVSLNGVLDRYFTSGERNSIIALQEELMMHVTLSLRALEKTIHSKLLSEQQLDELMIKINRKVLKKFADILREIKNDQNEIDFVELNQRLERARHELIPECREFLMDEIESASNNFTALDHQIRQRLKQEAFKNTTASEWDYLRTDSSGRSVSYISATKEASENKQLGRDRQAVQLVIRNHYEPLTNTVSTHNEGNIEAQVPSIAHNPSTHLRSVLDVERKLQYDVELLQKKNGHRQAPIIYNLLTSLHGKTYDLNDGQRKSAARILKGAHLFNFQQIQKGETEALVYVQNIPVDQHTNELSYDASDDATSEAALMTDMALLATLNQHSAALPPAARQSISSSLTTAHHHYLNFLPKVHHHYYGHHGNRYFKDSKEGQKVMDDLRRKKIEWGKADAMIPSDNLQSLAAQALFKMMANNHHQKKHFGLLAQSLSIFLEEMSLSGSKKADGLYQNVAGRVGLLKSICHEPRAQLSAEKLEVIEALEAFVAGADSVDKLNRALDKAYKQYNLHGAEAVITENDQGGPSNIKAKAFKSGFNRRIRFLDEKAPLSKAFRIALIQFLHNPDNATHQQALRAAAFNIYNDAIRACGPIPEKYMTHIQRLVKPAVKGIQISPALGERLQDFTASIPDLETHETVAFSVLSLAYNLYLKNNLLEIENNPISEAENEPEEHQAVSDELEEKEVDYDLLEEASANNSLMEEEPHESCIKKTCSMKETVKGLKGQSQEDQEKKLSISK
ncbi:hypothetical protein E3983_03375 [Legionella israelensis]|uniref:SidE PDE domain-containing protein n=1 Tax=Legionella israelensis TaxID=454 RepID=A0AAX1EEH9_9GAMM|nr:hypothetical protein [Legionella israelensis]QBR83488.1 hypothetical protein E3983_03375 [Legionella israelensis]